MPEMLPFDQLRQVLREVLVAAVNSDTDGVLAALQPVISGRDPRDLYRLVLGLIGVVVQSTPTPPVCPDHGPDGGCKPIATFGVLPAVNGQPDWSSVGPDGPTMVTPQFEDEHPELVAYMRLVNAQLSGDDEMTVALWCTALGAGHGPDILYHAIQVASQILRARKAALQ